ncbi:hypothetical protein PIROE2DRAFT_12838 [Piromyces sp. E2]|nr:hypothetical protein PIROE2DRAFT_12838 [Piromyces sp. E2]|eukprot:OUM61211.1 hypothetical protein PIROE2DRAFT_12838 [Piromyces sp. E2]
MNHNILNIINIEDFKFEKDKRDNYQKVLNFIGSNRCYEGLSFVLTGCPKTGKSTVMEQVMQNYEYSDKCAFYQVEDNDDLSEIYKICIDEIKKGLKIVMSCNESLFMTTASLHELKESLEILNCNFISFTEHCRLFHVSDIDDYIKYGGVIEKMASQNERTIHDYQSACDYIEYAISLDISGSIHKICDDNSIYELSKEEINYIVRTMMETYSGDFIGHKNLKECNDIKIKYPCKALNIFPYKEKHLVNRYVMENEDMKQDMYLKINSNEKINHKITMKTIKKFEYYLSNMGLLSFTQKVQFMTTENGEWEKCINKDDYYIIQPTLKYHFLKEKANLLENENFFKELCNQEQNSLRKELEQKIKDHMMKQIILYHTLMWNEKRTVDILKIEFYKNNKKLEEYNMLVYDKINKKHWIFEIKDTDNQYDFQQEHLYQEEVIANNYGKLEKLCVLYKGNSFITKTNIQYFNVTCYMKALEKYKDIIKVMDELIK